MLKTKCCNAYDTFWGDLHICRKCNRPHPEMVAEQTKQEKTDDRR